MIDQKFKELVGECLGEASLAWSGTPRGVFDSDKCKELIGKICNSHQELMDIEAVVVDIECQEEIRKKNVGQVIKEIKPPLLREITADGNLDTFDIPEGEEIGWKTNVEIKDGEVIKSKTAGPMGIKVIPGPVNCRSKSQVDIVREGVEKMNGGGYINQGEFRTAALEVCETFEIRGEGMINLRSRIKDLEDALDWNRHLVEESKSEVEKLEIRNKCLREA